MTHVTQSRSIAGHSAPAQIGGRGCDERRSGGRMVSYTVLAVAVVVALVIGVLIGRRRPAEHVVWEAPPRDSARAGRSSSGDDTALADPELLGHLDRDQTISAIKRYRELTGLGLKEAKDAVDAIQRDRKRSGS
jgi:hypothetical protein